MCVCFQASSGPVTWLYMAEIMQEKGLSLGTVISWLFARPQDGGQNGFSLTGGVLNYTAEVFYPSTGDRVSIEFNFKVQEKTNKFLV